MNKTEIGTLVKQRRRYLKISQKDLSDISGIGLRSLVDIESGKGNPTIENLQNVFKALGLTLEVKVKS